MNTNRKTAIVVGVLYIIGTVAGILSVVFTEPIRSAQDFLVSISANESQIVIGALFVLTMGLALAMVPVVAFPVLRKYNEALAVGYVVFRGGLEAITYMAMVISWLLLLPLSRLYQAGAPDASNFRALGSLLLETNQIFSVCTIVFILGALMFYYVLYQSRLVPCWLSGWGLIAAVPCFVTGVLGMFGLINSSAGSASTLHSVMVLPLAVQEMALALWLIVKGFNPSAVASLSGKTETKFKEVLA
jgi:hypothetical protein